MSSSCRSAREDLLGEAFVANRMIREEHQKLQEERARIASSRNPQDLAWYDGKLRERQEILQRFTALDALRWGNAWESFARGEDPSLLTPAFNEAEVAQLRVMFPELARPISFLH